ncbi:MAG: SpoIID/LytB domain-containing protein [Acidobacteriota bacterium]
MRDPKPTHRTAPTVRRRSTLRTPLTRLLALALPLTCLPLACTSTVSTQDASEPTPPRVVRVAEPSQPSPPPAPTRAASAPGALLADATLAVEPLAASADSTASPATRGTTGTTTEPPRAASSAPAPGVQPAATNGLQDAATSRYDGPLLLRVGLDTDLAAVDLPCCETGYQLAVDGGAVPLDQPMRVEPAASIGGASVWRLQVAALKDERQAQGLAQRLESATDLEADAVFDAGTDLYRVRVGRFALRDAADAARGALEVHGVAAAFLVSEGAGLRDPAFIVHRGERRARVAGRWLEVVPRPASAADDESSSGSRDTAFRYDGTLFRGRLLVYLNDRGRLNVINELPLEQYLRGVVPKEMGPELYNELEALKAQAVAARTYTVRNLDQFADEGYDLCSTPRCQVYGGRSVEHPLSDRAIAETAGQVVLFDGGPAETLYSATCGGHTENVEVVFPLKTGAYLRGVPCLEAGVTSLGGGARGDAPLESALMHRLLPPTAGPPAAVLSARLEHLALRAGLSVPRDRLRSLERGEVLRYVASIFDLALDRRLTSPENRLVRLLGAPPAGWGPREIQFATALHTSGLAAPPDDAELRADQAEMLLHHLALYLGVVERLDGHFLQAVSGVLRLRRGGEHLEVPLPDRVLTYRRRGDAMIAGELDLMAGDPLDVYRSGGQIVALVHPVDAPVVTLGAKHAPRQSWTRWKSDRALRAQVEERYPGFGFERFEILERGVSGRVGRLALHGTGGRRLTVEGLAIRWTLDLPDTLFWAERRAGRGGEPGWFFRGRGWGHGVGMSQAGAFGMARRGAAYRDILEHYYTGVELGVLRPLRPRPRPDAVHSAL